MVGIGRAPRRQVRVAGLVVAEVRRHPLGAFFVFACLFSWAYWIPAAVVAPHLSHFPGAPGPDASRRGGHLHPGGAGGLWDLLAPVLRWRVPLRWYAVALMPAAAGLLTLGALAAVGRGWPTLRELSTLPGLLRREASYPRSTEAPGRVARGAS